MGIDLRLIIAMGLTGFIAFWLISGTANPMQTSRRSSRRRWLRFARITGVAIFLSSLGSMFMTAGSFAEAYRNSVLLAFLAIVPLFMFFGAKSLLKELRQQSVVEDENQPDEEPVSAAHATESEDGGTALGLVETAGIPEFVVPEFAVNAADDASLALSEQAVEAAENVALTDAVPAPAYMTVIREANVPGSMLETDVLALNNDDTAEDFADATVDQLARMSELVESHDLGVERDVPDGDGGHDDSEAQKKLECYGVQKTELHRCGDSDLDSSSNIAETDAVNGELTTDRVDTAMLANQEAGLETALTALHQDNRRLQRLLIAQQSALDIERKSHDKTRLAEQHAIKLAQRAVASRAVAIKRLRQETVTRQRMAMRTRDTAAALKNAISTLDTERASHLALQQSYAKLTEGA
ncbi:MAG: hypothetical protein V3U76_09290 [Granulosicoccus sp.]